MCVWGKSNIWHCIKYTKLRIYLSAERTYNHITSVEKETERDRERERFLHECTHSCCL